MTKWGKQHLNVYKHGSLYIPSHSIAYTYTFYQRWKLEQYYPKLFTVSYKPLASFKVSYIRFIEEFNYAPND